MAFFLVTFLAMATVFRGFQPQMAVFQYFEGFIWRFSVRVGLDDYEEFNITNSPLSSEPNHNLRHAIGLRYCMLYVEVVDYLQVAHPLASEP